MSPTEHTLPILPVLSDATSVADATDPVCGMVVNPATAAGSVDHDGRTFYFCCRHCVEKFRANPGRYLGQSRWKVMRHRLSDRADNLRHKVQPSPARCTRRSSAPDQDRARFAAWLSSQ